MAEGPATGSDMANMQSSIVAAELRVPPRASLVWGAISRWLSMAVSILLGLAIIPIIMRTLGKECYGLWGLAASFVGFYGLFDFGISSAVARFLGNAIGAKDLRQLNLIISTVPLCK